MKNKNWRKISNDEWEYRGSYPLIYRLRIFRMPQTDMYHLKYGTYPSGYSKLIEMRKSKTQLRKHAQYFMSKNK